MEIDLESIWQREAAVMAFDRVQLAPAVLMSQRALPAPWQPPRILPNTIGNWTVGHHGVAADRPLSHCHIDWGHRYSYDRETREYYGGYLVAESIPNKAIHAAIAGLPRLARAAEALLNREGVVNTLGDIELMQLAEALAAAFPELLKPQTEQTQS